MGLLLPPFPRRFSRFAPYAPQSRAEGPMTATLTAPTPTPVKKTTRPKQNREAIFLFLPALLPVLLLSVYPLIRGIALGFTDARAGLNVDDELHRLRQLLQAAAQRPVLGLVPDRHHLDPVGHDPAVRRRARPRPAAQHDHQVPWRRPDHRPDPVGDAAGGGRDHVAAAAAPDQRPGQRDPAEPAPHRPPDQLPRQLQYGVARGDRGRHLGRHAA